MGSNFNSEGFAKNKISTYSTWDPMLLKAEFVNGYMSKKTGKFTPNNFNVFLKLDLRFYKYILDNGKLPGPLELMIRPGESLIVNHRYYEFRGEGLPLGEHFEMITNEGNQIGIGNKTPSNSYGLGQ